DQIDRFIIDGFVQIVQREMKRKTRLLETLADKIVFHLKDHFGRIKEIKVRVKKENPPLGGKVDCSYVEATESFVQKCGRCKKNMLCYGDATCWCQEPNVLPKTQEALASQFNGCLCKECLEFFAG
ncbi:MAG: cysteine-rich CWC family protein, partial [Bacteroidota bacterium]